MIVGTVTTWACVMAARYITSHDDDDIQLCYGSSQKKKSDDDDMGLCYGSWLHNKCDDDDMGLLWQHVN